MENDKLETDGGEDEPESQDDVPAERERGILSHADRQYLRGEKELTTQSERDARYRIRNRVQNAILDFGLLAQALEEEDREQISSKIEPMSLIPISDFTYKLLYDKMDSFEDTEDFFEAIITSGISSALADLDTDHVIEDVDVDIHVEKWTPELGELRQKLKQGEESMAEFNYLQRNDELPDDMSSRERFIRHLEHMYEEGTINENQNLVVQFDEEGEETLDLDDFGNPEEFLAALQERILEG